MKVRTLDSELNIDYSGTIVGLLLKMNLNPLDYLVIINGELVHETFILNGGEEVEVVPVVSGG